MEQTISTVYDNVIKVA